MNKTKKSLLFSGLALMMSALLLAGTTFAWFTDSVTNKGNVITSGNLSIEAVAYDLSMGNDASQSYQIEGINNGEKFFFESNGQNLKEDTTAIISEDLWEPGVSNAKLLTVTNTGSLATNVQVKFDVKDGGLMNALWFDFINVENGQFTKRPMSQLAALGDATTVTLEAKESVSFILVYGMDEEAGNEYQGKDFSADVKIVATQATVEKDGFNNDQYDADATGDYADYNVTTEEELNKALEDAQDGDVIALSSDMKVTGTITVDKAVTIDGNGATFKGSESGATTNAFNIVSGVDGVTIKDCNITNAAFGVHVQPGAGDVTIDGCTFSGTKSNLGTAVWVNGGNTGTVTIKNSTFSRVVNLSGVNNTVTNVVLENNKFNTGWSCNGITICGSLENVTIRNNEFNQIGEAGIRVHEDGLKDFNLKNILIENNTFTSTDISVDTAVKDLWDAAVQAGDVVINNN